jgi:uncharacterized protein (DUF1778 family)
MSEERETIYINQRVDAESYRKLKAVATLQKKSVTRLVNEAIIEKAANTEIKL